MGRVKAVVLFKMVLWSIAVVWAVFFITFSLIITQVLSNWASTYFEGSVAVILSWTLPIWALFTTLLTCVFVIRYVARRLR